MTEEFVTTCEPCREYICFSTDYGYDFDDRYHEAKDSLAEMLEYMQFDINSAYPDSSEPIDGNTRHCEVCGWPIRYGDLCYRIGVSKK